MANGIGLADVPDRYQGRFSAQFCASLACANARSFSPVKRRWPFFPEDFLLTPDGILATLGSPNAKEFGVTCPLWRMTEHPLPTRIINQTATVADRDHSDEQCFLSLTPGTVTKMNEARIQSTYGCCVRSG